MAEVTKKEIVVPRVEDLQTMIERNLAEGRSKMKTTICLRGYLAALLVEGAIESEAYHRLASLLPPQWGKAQAMEIFIGPDAVDRSRFPDEEE